MNTRTCNGCILDTSSWSLICVARVVVSHSGQGLPSNLRGLDAISVIIVDAIVAKREGSNATLQKCVKIVHNSSLIHGEFQT